MYRILVSAASGLARYSVGGGVRPSLFEKARREVVAGSFAHGGSLAGSQRFLAYNANSAELSTNALSYHVDRPAYIRDVLPTTEQVDFFQDNGYLVMKDLLDPTHLQTWRDTIDGAVGVRGDDWSFPRKGQVDITNVDMQFYSKVFTQRLNLWMTDDKAKRLLFAAQAVLGRAACMLVGLERVRLWHDQALYKEPWANATSWHLDVPYWSFDSLNAVSAWVALDDATLDNGCMHFVPGSQKLVEEDYRSRQHFREIKIGSNMGAVFDYYPAAKAMPSTPVAVKAGSVSFHRGTLIHGAGANMTCGRRRAMTMAYMPDGAVFNGKQNVLTDEQFAVLRLGDRLTDDSLNPLLYDTAR